MKWQELIDQIADMVSDPKIAFGQGRMLYIQNGVLCLGNRMDIPPDAINVAYIRSSQIRYGLTSREWFRLEEKIRALIKEGKL